MDNVHEAGLPEVIAEVRDGDNVWRSAVGVADVETGRSIRPDMRHRVGSISKTFATAAILQQVERGHIVLGKSISHYFLNLSQESEATQSRSACCLTTQAGWQNTCRMHIAR